MQRGLEPVRHCIKPGPEGMCGVQGPVRETDPALQPVLMTCMEDVRPIVCGVGAYLECIVCFSMFSASQAQRLFGGCAC